MSTIRQIFGMAEPNEMDAWAVKVEGKFSNPTLVMGLEIEAEKLPRSHGHYTKVMGDQPWNIETDGSLRGRNIDRRSGEGVEEGNALEFVSYPLRQPDLVYHLREFFRVTGISEESFESDRTSIHVHVNMQDRTIPYIKSLMYVYSAVEKCLFHFVGREREQNIYCVPLYSTMMMRNLNTLLRGNLSSLGAFWQKYTALNLLPLTGYGTVEFRHMHGTADVEKLTKWLNIIGRIVTLAEQPYKEMRQQLFDLNTTSAYEKFFYDVFGNDVKYSQEYAMLLEDGVLALKTTEIVQLEVPPTSAPPVRPLAPRRSLWPELTATGTRPMVHDSDLDVDPDEEEEEELLAQAHERQQERDAIAQWARDFDLRQAAETMAQIRAARS